MSIFRAWNATCGKEEKKLASSAGWNLASGSSLSSANSPALSRTRGTANKKRGVNLDLSSLEPPQKKRSTSSGDAEVTTTSSSSADSTGKKTKPAASRVIMESQMLRSMMERHLYCPKCRDPVVVSFPTICIASGCKIECSNEMCDFIDMERPETADLPHVEGSALIERSTDYATNVLYVLGFLASGDGGKEAERVLGFLGLSNSTTMEKRSFPIIENRLSPIIVQLTDEILLENLTKAVAIHYGDRRLGDNGPLLFDLWKEQIQPDNLHKEILPAALYPQLTCSSDMAWQKRSSGNSYDSNSGDAFLVESLTRKPVGWIVKSKICNICKAHKDDAAPVRPHTCTINHVGSSGSMEALAIKDMVVELYDTKRVITKDLITDDDSSIKAKVKWSNEDYMLNNNTNDRPKIINRNGNEVLRPNHGALPRHIPEPGFLADPNHRKKTLKGQLYRHYKKRKADRDGLTKVDIMRVSTNFAYCVRTLSSKPIDEYELAGKAVVEHHFDNHEFCGDFCKRKLLTAEQKEASNKIYRSKEENKKLYLFLTNTVARFITLDALKEVGHGSDTQVNESLNNFVAWLAPKNKTYSGSMSLSNRISIALGIHSIGTLAYFERLFTKLGITVSDDILHYLTKQERTRNYRIQQYKKKEVKKERNFKLHNRLREYSEQLIIKKEGGAVYQPGIGMDGGYQQQAAAVADGNNTCQACGEAGHKRRTSKKCRFYKARAPTKKAPTTEPDETASSTASAVDQAAQDAEEQELMDAVGFDASDDEFFDALERDEEDDDCTSWMI